ncbi:MAG TPA: 6-hydroxymethylpterin diphosphokinase MptE-like protein [Polyangiaceae bacterium]
MSTRTRELVLASPAKGRIVRERGGASAIDVGGSMLGAHGDLGSRERTLGEIAEQGNTVVVVFGLGLGHTVRELAARTKSKIIIFEPDPGVLRRVLEWGPSDLAGIPIVSDLVDFSVLWSAASSSRAKAVLVRTPGYELAYPEALAELEGTLRRLVSNIQINENTYFFRARLWLEDIFQNLPHTKRNAPFMVLEDHYRGVPAFIVGAGPSLDKNGALLREAAKKGIVIAANTAAAALARIGVTPQVLACIESLDLSHGIGALPFIDEVVRAFSLSGHPAHMTTGKGPLLPIFENIASFEPLVRLFGCRGLPVGASVTTAAFSLADRLGCDPIILVGQDLAFTENQVYAKGTDYEGSTVRIAREDKRVDHNWAAAAVSAHGTSQGSLPRAEPLIEMKGWGGTGTVATSPSFAAVNAWLETSAAVIARTRPDKRLINATEGGARIQRFEEMSLRQALSALPERGITAADIARDAAATGRAPSDDRLATWAGSERAIAARVRETAELLEKLVERAIPEVRGDDNAAMSRTFNQLEQVERKLRADCAEQPLIEAWSCAELQAIEQKSAGAKVADSSRAQALHALRTEGEIAKVIARAAGDVENRLGTLETTSTTKLNQ